MYYKNRFKDKVMIITGAASGIGRETAIRAALEGAKVVIVDKDKIKGEETLAAIKSKGKEAIFLNLDISIEENAKQMVDETIKAYGQLDIAINDAGVMGKPVPLHELSKDELDFVMNNNFYSVAFCCKYELSQFIFANKGGVIINVGSVGGLTGLPGTPAYVASKFAVNGLTKNLALDYAKYRIRINSINPSSTVTPMIYEAQEYVNAQKSKTTHENLSSNQLFSSDDQKTKSLLEQVEGHPATPSQQAAAILFLASNDASVITGATIPTDGGWTAF